MKGKFINKIIIKIFFIVILLTISIVSIGQNKNDVNLGECWTLKVCDSVSGCYEAKYYFLSNGEFKSTYRNTIGKKSKAKLFEKGTYYYNNNGYMFLSVSTTNYFNKKKKYPTPLKKCFFLIIPLDEIGKTNISYNVILYNDWEKKNESFQTVGIGKVLLGDITKEKLK